MLKSEEVSGKCIIAHHQFAQSMKIKCIESEKKCIWCLGKRFQRSRNWKSFVELNNFGRVFHDYTPCMSVKQIKDRREREQEKIQERERRWHEQTESEIERRERIIGSHKMYKFWKRYNCRSMTRMFPYENF